MNPFQAATRGIKAVAKAGELAVQMGPGWLFWRGLYEIALRSRVMEKAFRPKPLAAMYACSLGKREGHLDDFICDSWQNASVRFFFDDPRTLGWIIPKPDIVLSGAEAVLAGKITLFGKRLDNFGNPPDWFLNVLDGTSYPADAHWSRIPDLSEELGDIKSVWELSRFPHAYLLARAYAVTGDDRYAEGFWQHFESWVARNRLEMGPNWRCGQEISLRSLAWIFALYCFKESPSSSKRRQALLIRHLWYNGRHIERNNWYARRCLHNNHTFSEAAGLFTLGLLFPFFSEAHRWRQKGLRLLIREIDAQILDDGTYAMHSLNYARFVGQILTWCLRLARLNGEDLPDHTYARIKGLVHFLRAIQEPETGRVPNYGSNDGSLVFPLSSCDYLDYRPALNALGLTLGFDSPYGAGPWDEEAAWFGLGRKLEAGPAKEPQLSSRAPDTALGFPKSGYYTLRQDRFLAFIRCGRHRHRPAQADMLHLDLWYGRSNIFGDPGTYTYNPRGGWSKYFAGTAAHNTITVDGRDQMRRDERFLWLDWVQGRRLSLVHLDQAAVFIGEHYGYSPVIHRRIVVITRNGAAVIDDLFGEEKNHEYALHWLATEGTLQQHSPDGGLIAAGDARLRLQVACSRKAEGSWQNGQEEPRRGWQSLYYGVRHPVWSYRMIAESSGPLRFITMLTAGSEESDAPVLTETRLNALLESAGLGGLPAIGGRWLIEQCELQPSRWQRR